MSRQSRKAIRDAYKEAYEIKAKEVNAQNVLRTDYYRGYLWRLFLGSVAVKVPPLWSIDYFRAVLLGGGGICVGRYKGAVVPFAYTVGKRNAWHYPITVNAMNELQDIGELEVGKECELIYLDSANYESYFSNGIWPVIDLFAQRLANCDGGIDINLINSRSAWLFEASSANEAEDMKALYTKIMSGEPAVYWRRNNDNPLERQRTPVTTLPIKQNYIAGDMQDTKRSIVNEFLTAVGINNANTDKKERLITSEVAANDEELTCAVGLWQDNVNRTIEKVKALFGDELGGELSVTFLGEERRNAAQKGETRNDETN